MEKCNQIFNNIEPFQWLFFVLFSIRAQENPAFTMQLARLTEPDQQIAIQTHFAYHTLTEKFEIQSKKTNEI